MNIWAATKSADKSTTFPIVCHNICFLRNILGMWSPTSTFVGCFGITANSMASVVKAEKERVWSLYLLFGWVDSRAYPWPSCEYSRNGSGIEPKYKASNRPVNSVQSMGLGLIDRSVHSLIHSINYSRTSTMCMGSHPAQAWDFVWWLSKPGNKYWPEALGHGQLESSRDSDGVQRG